MSMIWCKKAKNRHYSEQKAQRGTRNEAHAYIYSIPFMFNG